ncbi:MAG: tetratricopeptide repeat protein, partial [Candidatus Eisenbacteria bacterium]
ARRLVHVALPVAGGLILAASLLLAGGYSARWFQLDFLTGRESHPFLVPGRELLDPRHWKDILNLLMLLVPVPLAMTAGLLAGWWRGRAGNPRDGRAIAILLGGCGWLVLLMVVLHQRLGIVRDWDLFAAPAGIFALTAILLWQSRMPGERGSAQPAAAGRAGESALVLAAAALLISAPWFWLNAGEARSLARFRDVIEDLPRFPRAYAHEEIGKYFRKAGNLTEARREYEVCVSIHPTNPRFHALLGSMLYNQGDADAALPVFQRVFELDSTYTTGLEMLARIHIERGQHAQALEYARRLAGKRGERAAAAVHHGIAAANLQLYPEAAQAYERALRLEPGNPSHLERLGAILLISGDAARAEQAFQALLSKDPANRTALLGLLTALWLPCELDPSSAMDARGQGRLKEARALVDRLASAGESEENLAEWRVKIAAVSDRGGAAAPRP